MDDTKTWNLIHDERTAMADTLATLTLAMTGRAAGLAGLAGDGLDT